MSAFYLMNTIPQTGNDKFSLSNEPTNPLFNFERNNLPAIYSLGRVNKPFFQLQSNTFFYFCDGEFLPDGDGEWLENRLMSVGESVMAKDATECCNAYWAKYGDW